MHGLDNNVSVLRRWAAHSPDTALPRDWDEFAKSNLKLSEQISQDDPELVSLLRGTANATLRANELTGQFSATPPDPEKAKQDEKQETIRQLVEMQPWQNGRLVHMTAALMLEDLAPETARKERRKAGFMNPDEVDEQKKKEHEASMRRLHQMEADGLRARLQQISR